MIKTLSLIGATIAMGAASFAVPTAAAEAQSYQRYERGDRYYAPRRYQNYDRYQRSYRYQPRYNRYAYRGERCDSGTGGTIVGAIAGGLLGHEVVGRRGDRTAGTIIGGAVGALAGNAIDRSGNPRYCR
jgi:uncharacterized protein YcfJ